MFMELTSYLHTYIYLIFIYLCDRTLEIDQGIYHV